jgi:hypothetical protein
MTEFDTDGNTCSKVSFTTDEATIVEAILAINDKDTAVMYDGCQKWGSRLEGHKFTYKTIEMYFDHGYFHAAQMLQFNTVNEADTSYVLNSTRTKFTDADFKLDSSCPKRNELFLQN